MSTDTKRTLEVCKDTHTRTLAAYAQGWKHSKSLKVPRVRNFLLADPHRATAVVSDFFFLAFFTALVYPVYLVRQHSNISTESLYETWSETIIPETRRSRNLVCVFFFFLCSFIRGNEKLKKSERGKDRTG